jgi:DNA-binding NtrC family response regulator
MPIQPNILIVDDDPDDNQRYCQVLQSAGYQVQSVSDVDQALQIIATQVFDVVLVDMLLPMRLHGKLDFGGLEVLRRVKQRDLATQVIAITGYGNRELAAEAMQNGAMEFITKDPDAEDRLPGSIRVALARVQQFRSVKPGAEDNQQNDMNLATPDHLIADSLAMRQLLRRAQRLAHIDGPLLIAGEPGVGKTLIASLIHINSHVSTGPFVTVVCRHLSSDFREFWGEKSGMGFCSQAEGGTLVLKGIQDLPYNFDQQKRLVTLIETGSYQTVDTHETIQFHGRIIATATGDLDRQVTHGKFWRPLYEELSVASLDVPPLRERRDKDDVLAIAGHLLHRYSLATGIASSAAELLATYDYAHANIKELEEILRSAAGASSGAEIQPEHLPEKVHRTRSNTNKESASPTVPASTNTTEVPLSVSFVPNDSALLIWESHAGGSTYSHFSLPFDESDVPLLLRALDAVQWPGHPMIGPQFTNDEQTLLSHYGLWNGNRVAEDVDRRIGHWLYQALVAEPAARSALESARNIATDRRLPLAITLRFPADAVKRAALPWELLWDERQALLLSRGELSSCVRYINLPQALPTAPATSQTLRLLAACPRAGIPEELHREEHQIRTQALQPLSQEGMIRIEDVRPVRISDLTDRLQDGEPIDIFHFYGHGIWKNDTAYLQFDDGLLSANQLAALLGNTPLVVLHACRSATVAEDDLFTGIAPMLSAEGVPTVVAMQFTVSIQAANRFSQVLYRNLARSESVQTAVAKARQALYLEHKESWYVPVVYIRSQHSGPVSLVRK